MHACHLVPCKWAHGLQIGVALEIPFELLIKHFTASYSAAQAAILEAWRFFLTRRAWLVDSFCDPVYEAVVSEGVALGRIAAPGFFSDPILRAAWLETVWTGPPRGSIDPRKEVDAYVVMEDRQWKTSAEITAELTGGDWKTNSEIRAREQKYRREHDLLTETAHRADNTVNKAQKDTSQTDISDDQQEIEE